MKFPNNLEQLGPGHLGRFAGVLPLAGPVAGGIPLMLVSLGSVIGNWSGGYNSDVEQFAKSITYGRTDKVAGIHVDGDAKMFRRDDGKVDLVVPAKINFTVNGWLNDERTESVYQDTCAFSISPVVESPNGPADPVWKINSNGVAPENENAQIAYSWVHGWKATAGMKGVGKYDDKGPGGSAEVTAGAEMTFTTQTSMRVPEFGIKGTLDQPMHGMTWSADMRQSYADGKPFLYSILSPLDLVINGVNTKWLKEPPSLATSTFSLPFLATFSSTVPDPPLGVVKLRLSTVQRIMYAYVAGRWGLKGARVGGSGVVVPAWYSYSATLVLDVAGGSIRLDGAEAAFKTLGS